LASEITPNSKFSDDAKEFLGLSKGNSNNNNKLNAV